LATVLLTAGERLLGEVVAAAAAGLGVDSRKLCVRHRRQERQDEREDDSRPDVGGNRAPVGRRGGSLQLIRDPEKRPGRDQRHGVDRGSREPERRLHRGWAASFLRHGSPPPWGGRRNRRASLEIHPGVDRTGACSPTGGGALLVWAAGPKKQAA